MDDESQAAAELAVPDELQMAGENWPDDASNHIGIEVACSAAKPIVIDKEEEP